jgi:TadE-like protein
MTGFLHRFRTSEDGSATIEFVLWVPLFLSLFLWSFEQGYYLLRQVGLDRAVDLAVRDVRLGAFDDLIDPSLSEAEQTALLHDAVKDRVCDFAFLIRRCQQDVKLEMRQVDPRNWATLGDTVDCVDRSDAGRPVNQFTPGQSNDLMMLRACALFDPLYPTSGLGARLAEVGGGTYALVAVSSFAVEPVRRD